VIRRVCWSFRSLLHYDRCDLFEITRPIFMKFYTYVEQLRQTSLLTFHRSRSKFKVITAILKVIDDNSTATIQQILGQILEVLLAGNVAFDKIQDGGLVERGCLLSLERFQ